MPARITIQPNSSFVQLAPGAIAEVQFGVTNAGTVVDLFTMSLNGLEPDWYALAPEEVRLFPSQSATVTLVLHSPSNALAGVYSFAITATSRDDPTQIATAALSLTLRAGGRVLLDLAPRKASGRKGLYTINLRSLANNATRLTLAVTDPEEALYYALGAPDTQQQQQGTPYAGKLGKIEAQAPGKLEYDLEAPAGAITSVPMLVKPRKRVWAGPEILFAFEVALHPPGIEWDPAEAQKVGGEFAYRPVLAAWSGLPLSLRRAMFLAFPLALLALLLFLLLRGPQSQEPGASTLTPFARSNGADDATAGSAGTGIGGGGTPTTGSGQGAGENEQQSSLEGPSFVNSFYMALPPAGSAKQAPGVPQVEWNITYVDNVTIAQTSRPANLPGLDTSSVLDYNLTGTSSGRNVTNTVGVLLIRPASIEMFAANPLTITQGQSTTLLWTQKGGKAGTIDDAPVELGSGGSGQAGVTPPGTHRYKLCITNPAGQVCRTAKITVLPGTASTQPPATASPAPTSAVPQPPTPTSTLVPTRAATATQQAARPSATLSPRASSTAPALPSATLTSIPTNAPTRTPTATPTGTSTATATPSPSPSTTPTRTATPSPTTTSTPTPTASPTPICERAFVIVDSPNQGGNAQLAGVAAIAPDNVWAVGSGGNNILIEHWDGNQWTIDPVSNNTPGVLSAISVRSRGDIWAVGYFNDDTTGSTETLIEHYDGNTWTPVQGANRLRMSNLLYGVAARAADDVWAVGYSYSEGPYLSLVEHWDGNAWTVVPSPSPGDLFNYLYSVAALGASDVWAVGYTANRGSPFATLIERWDGNAWTIVPSADPGSSSNILYSVAAISANKVWAVGESASGNVYNTLIERWNGSNWSVVAGPNPSPMSNGLKGAWARAANDIWAVGSTADPNGRALTLIEHWDGQSWSVVPSPNRQGGGNLRAVSGLPATDVWTVGSYDNGNDASYTLTERYTLICGTPTPTPVP